MPLRVLIVPDKFKGTLTAREAAQAIARGWHRRVTGTVHAHALPGRHMGWIDEPGSAAAIRGALDQVAPEPDPEIRRRARPVLLATAALAGYAATAVTCLATAGRWVHVGKLKALATLACVGVVAFAISWLAKGKIVAGVMGLMPGN